ncbi:MAG: citrate lyase subunit beta/citryl-CoA lyase, partial [Oceanicoccus sp.]
AVSPDKKSAARQLVVEAVNAASKGDYGYRKVCVRVNGLDTPWGVDDLEAIALTVPDAVLLPKINSATDVQEAVSILKRAGLQDKTSIWVMMETPLGILHAEDIAASDRVAALVMGTADLVSDIRGKHTIDRLPVLASLSICVLAARAYKRLIFDGVFLDLDDEMGFDRVCQQGSELGFDGKTLIHPKQLHSANKIFSPSENEILFSKKVIESHAQATRSGQGVVLVNGKLIENLHVEDAKRIVAFSDAIAARESNLTHR